MAAKSEVGTMIMTELKWIMCNGLPSSKISPNEIEATANTKPSMVDRSKTYPLI
ncbi:hypothetical protein HMPREF1408_01422 [Helicobacter pylori GAM245Ai]|uniref:Uncharacterized protein n=5 Tax=Helicobacter pylori TaxID=210 RepID=M3NCT7_HELPX|nr:hypothetical protein HMPREF1391_00457 [Helicobacter pylori GAM100Ai]EMG81677.1 hypothetical protein HMPREF1394_01188 [Helicobacter pylori GAM105Ai]EMG83814.1 hypothetical protein HMPREF1393_00309 [Helicobacter pylori GAM103Bi]EMG83840.1 hypothetical protein HMPREF1392_00539 [Helicobacter pylori GAM101Biv]EMG85467.1 hypothetical protein HMPREF1397_01722 [Helicobacter pylori GAM115Ai]EMG85973.1 hypothetical protein HMPREF1395_01388 [Helicobacter pylori GAM112Ai]EMG89060.1 hypothetical protei